MAPNKAFRTAAAAWIQLSLDKRIQLVVAVDSSGACGEAVGGSNGGLSSPSRRGVTFGFGGSGSGGRRKPTTSAAAVAALAVAGSFELGDPIAHWFPGCKREFLMDDAEDEDDVAMDVFKRSRFN